MQKKKIKKSDWAGNTHFQKNVKNENVYQSVKDLQKKVIC